MASSGLTNNNASNKYIPGVLYQGSDGATVSEFESDTGFAKAVPIEPGFFEDPKSKNNAIIVYNLTGRTISTVLNKPKPVNANFPNYRENEVEMNGFNLPAGEGSHFNVGFRSFIFQVDEFVNSERGTTKRLTPEGITLGELANTIITVSDGDEDGILQLNIAQSNTNYFLYIVNDSSRDIRTRITKTSTAYGLSNSEIMMQKRDRKVDNGGEIIHTNFIRAGATGHIKHPHKVYVCRALEPDSEYNFDGQKTGAPHALVEVHTEVSPKNDYSELACVEARVGTVVVWMLDGKRRNVIGKVYSHNEIKPVSPDIVITKRQVVG